MHYELNKWRGALFCLCLAFAAAGCSMSDDLDCPPEGGLANSGKTYIRLSFAMPGSGSTRATGGELGDGQEAGQNEENTISSAVAFLYKADDVNADGETPIAAVVEFNSLNGPDAGTDRPDPEHDIDKVYTTAAQEVPEIEFGTYHVIVAANLSENDDTRWWTGGKLTLDDVRDHILTSAWTTDENGSYSNFLMTNEADASIELKEENTSANPAETTVDVERVVARVDYKTKNSYTIENENTNVSGTITINGAYIVNRLDAGSYFLKRVTEGDDINGEIEYLGNETADGNGVATNYVLDPWTKNKNTNNADLNQNPFTVGGTKVNASKLYADDTYFPNGSEDPEDWAGWCKEGDEVTDPDDENETWRRIGYCMENTTASDATMKQYNTGIVFKAKFEPTGVNDYKPGNTFFTYDGKFYTSLTKMMGEINSEENFASHVTEQIENKDIDGIHTFAQTLKDDPVGYKTYLLNQTGDKVYDWTEYLLNVLGVDERDEDKGPQINQIIVSDKKTRAILYGKSGGRIRTYYKGQCYYIWWLRHSDNDDDTTNGIMEYAVVRNNIYKLNVTDVSSLGGDIPNVEGLRVNVSVHDWVMLDIEELPM